MFNYRGAGLGDIQLINGFTEHNTPFGKSVSIEDLDGLHKAIGRALVDSKPELTGSEFRFLRLELDMAQKTIADYIGVEAQTVANWEKGKIPVQKYGDHIIRHLYKHYFGGDPDIVALVNRLNDLEIDAFKRISFERNLDEGIPTWKMVHREAA